MSIIQCSNCGTPITRKPYQLKAHKHHFCDIQCKSEWMSANLNGKKNPAYAKITIACDQCRKQITRSPSVVKGSKRHFCSRLCFGEWNSENKIGFAHPRFKKIQIGCDWCGETLWLPPHRIDASKCHFCDLECYGKWQSENRSGENNSNWHGGYEPYYGPNWKNQSKHARERDNYTCQHCGISEKKYGQALDVHHIMPFREFDYAVGENENYKQANKLTNLICLCKQCHQFAEHGHIPVQLSLPISSET